MAYCHGPEETNPIYKAELCVWCVCVCYGMDLLPFIAAFQSP